MRPDHAGAGILAKQAVQRGRPGARRGAGEDHPRDAHGRDGPRRRNTPCLIGASRLLTPPPARDVPHRLHRLPPHHVDLVVEVDGWIAVRREELDELAERRQRLMTLEKAADEARDADDGDAISRPKRTISRYGVRHRLC